MTFTADINRFKNKIRRREKEVFDRTAELVFESVVEGSSVTGSPGQPIADGILKTSWQLIKEGKFIALIITNAAHAPPIEDGVGPHGPLTLRSEVGGFHSVKLTRAGYSKILKQARREVR